MPGSLAAARQQLPRGLSRRENTLDEMLDHYTDVQEVCVDRAGAGMGDGGVIQMPAAWNDSYRELDRVLTRMRGLATADGEASPRFRAMYVNLRHWYLAPVTQMRYRKLRKLNGRTVEVFEATGDSKERVRRVLRSTSDGGKAKAGLVLLAVEWVCGEFVGEPYRPLCRDCKTAGRGSHPVWACQCVSGALAA